MIKMVAPSMAYQVIDRAIQVSHPALYPSNEECRGFPPSLVQDSECSLVSSWSWAPLLLLTPSVPTLQGSSFHILTPGPTQNFLGSRSNLVGDSGIQ